MPLQPLEVKSLSEFVDKISEFRTKWEAEVLWFRGHQKSWWSLTPKLYRVLRPDDNARDEEDDIREDFIRRAPSLTDRAPKNPWEWYFLMQHYSVPTRLLDWTDSSLVGLYFAIRGNGGSQDAAVWILDPYRLNKWVIGKSEILPPGSDGLAKADVRRCSPWLPDRFDSQRPIRNVPIAVYPNYIGHRIMAQRSCFTVHGRKRDGLEGMFPVQQRRQLLAKIVIPANRVEQMEEDLMSCGVDEVTVFPDLEGLGRGISMDCRLEAPAPHEGTSTRLAPSRVHKGGVGVFAVKKIRKGACIFPGDFDGMRWVGEDDIPVLPSKVRKLYDDFAVIKEERDKNGALGG